MDTIVAMTERVAIGRFRCPVSHPSFRDSGPASDCIVVFPRTGVWIRHEGARAFLADPNIVTIYNGGQRYERSALAHDGDRCDWFAVSDDLAREIAGAFDSAARDSDRPFRFRWAPTTTSLYFRQRALLRRAEHGRADALEVEESVIAIVEAVIAAAHTRRPLPRARRTGGARRHRELADAARGLLANTYRDNTSVRELADALGTSPYHLCRVFRACTGRTMHEYRTELRVRHAFEALEGRAAFDVSLSAVAHELGFASHSHFVTAMRRHIGDTPSAVRAAVRSLTG